MFEELKNVLSEQLGIETDITMESKLKEELGIDSLLALELSITLENKYNIDISEEELTTLKTVKDVVKLLESKGVNA